MRIIKVGLGNKRGGKQNTSSEHVVKGKETETPLPVYSFWTSQPESNSAQNRCFPKRCKAKKRAKNKIQHRRTPEKPVSELLAQLLQCDVKLPSISRGHWWHGEAKKKGEKAAGDVRGRREKVNRRLKKKRGQEIRRDGRTDVERKGWKRRRGSYRSRRVKEGWGNTQSV